MLTGMWRLLLLLCTIFLICCSKEFTAKVVAVSDGDTLVVQQGSTRKKIRLYGIDCPEGNQQFGSEAKRFTMKLVLSKQVRIEPLYNDPHHRIVAKVFLPDETYVNAEITGAGYAWWYRRYAKGDQVLENREREAKSAGRGIWADLNPVPPWNFRHQERPLHGDPRQ